jgi:hypothetical protein
MSQTAHCTGASLDRASHGSRRAAPAAAQVSSPSHFDAERRPPNAFILFSRSLRPAVQSKHPSINNIDCTRILADAWRALPEEERLPFKRLAAEMQRKFKESNPHYSYRKSVQRRGLAALRKSEPAVEPPLQEQPCPFRWDMMLNHHDDTSDKVTRYICDLT